MAEEEAIEGVVTVLYGDAPGTDIHKEYKEALRHYHSACAAITQLKTSHLTQLETFESESYPELSALLWGSLCLIFGEEVSDDSMLALQSRAYTLPERIAKTDINKVKL